MLQIQSLRFSIGKTEILTDVSADFAPGRLHGIIGPNGAGKSTLLKNMARIWTPTGGTLYIDGIDYRTLSRKTLSKQLTMVPQSATIHFPISVYEVVAMGRHPHLNRFGVLRPQDRDMVEESLATAHIEGFKDRNINELSGGEQRLAVIARALATGSHAILLDEPTADLDIRHALMIMKVLSGLAAEGKTILMSIHDLNFARRFCDTVTILDRGRLIYSGTPAEAFTPHHILTVFGVQMTQIEQGAKTCLYFTSPS